MSLWIRSQDKSYFIPIKDIISEFGGSLFYKGIILGDYKTSERSLEVLDEIQKVMQAKYALNFDEKKESFRNFSPTQCQKLIENMAVYEMPKD